MTKIYPQDNWQKIPLSYLAKLSRLLEFKYDSQSEEADTWLFEPKQYKTHKSYRTALAANTKDWTERPDNYLDILTEKYRAYLPLVKRINEIINDVDPLHDLLDSNPIRKALDYELVYDDTDTTPATLDEVLDFHFNLNLSFCDHAELCKLAIFYNRIDVVAAVGLSHKYQGKDRFQAILNERQADLGRQLVVKSWAKYFDYPDYAVLIHPLLLKVKDIDIKLLEQCTPLFKFYSPDGQMRNENKTNGILFRAWWQRNKTPDNAIVIETILGYDLETLTMLGRELQPCHKLLGINSDATKYAINKAFKKLASIHHPDKGGDHIRMQKLNQARQDALALI